ncbi:MAG: ATP-dependent Clp protease ATP-binding subunit [Candidatus Geothermincolia bacterium]
MKMTVRNAAGEQRMIMLCGMCSYRFTNVLPNMTATRSVGSGGQLVPELFSESHFPTQRLGAFQGYSTTTQQALGHAERITRELGIPLIGTFQLLMGICSLNAPASLTLERHGVTLDKLEVAVQKAMDSGTMQGGAPGQQVQPAQVQMQSNALSVLEMAQSNAVGTASSFIEPEHILLAMIELPQVSSTRWMQQIGVNMDALKADLMQSLADLQAPGPSVTEATPEEQLSGLGTATSAQAGQVRDTNALAKFSEDLTSMAEQGKLMPVIGREIELNRVELILSRLQKNNPILLGEPGVGKTAIVEALAQHIAGGTVPTRLKGCRVYEVDLASIVAGTQMRGEFEQRMKDLLVQVEKLGPQAILFIDESHTLVGAGASEGSMDAGNILKPALARGQLHLIGATTKAEYQKYIEKDPALSRRFQPVLVGEPTTAQAIEMIVGILERFEKHHNVTVSHEAVAAAVTLSNQYITDRFLPDKAIDLVDEACSAVAIANEKSGEGRAVIAEDVASVISEITGIPLNKMIEPEKKRLLQMEDVLHQRLINQEEAVEAVANVVKRSRAGLKDPHKPNGSFIFAGPTGVGKTELARSLAEFLFDNEDALIRIDMSEYMEKESVSRLIGAPPGYAGYDEGGQLTEKVKFRPYSVVLFDEMEKANPQVLNILLQVADAGCLTDGKGRTVNFRNTIIILTTNVGADLFYQGAAANMSSEDLKARVTDMLVSATSPELINRMDAVIVFTSLTEDQVKQVIKLQVKSLGKRLKDQNISIEVTDAALSYMAKAGYDPKMGARPAKRLIQNEIESPLSDMILGEVLKPGGTAKVGIDNGKLTITAV